MTLKDWRFPVAIWNYDLASLLQLVWDTFVIKKQLIETANRQKQFLSKQKANYLQTLFSFRLNSLLEKSISSLSLRVSPRL